MKGPLILFSNLPIERKLLLASVIPILVLILLSLVTYQSVSVFSNDEDQLTNIYLVQRKAAEYMRLAVDLETGFRGFVLTGQEAYLKPFLMAQDRILAVGDSLIEMVGDRDTQRTIMVQVQALVKRLMSEKHALIDAVRAGHTAEADHYVEQGRGRSSMVAIRQQMHEFDRLEQDVLNEALAKLGQDRAFMVAVILGGGLLSLVLMIFTLHIIARSIAVPLVNLAKTVESVSGGVLPELPVLDRQDEIGDLTRVMKVMTTQIRDHIARIEKSEAALLSLNRDLAASESKYRSIVDLAPFGIFTTRGMALVFSNRYNFVLAGLNPDVDHDPETVRNAFHPEDRDRVLSEFAHAVEQDRPYETVFRFLHPDGTVKKVLSLRIPIHDREGRTVMYQGFNVDITLLDQMQARLARSERLATLGQVAAGIAHEIRNPLVGIGTTASLLIEDAAPDDARRQDLEIILRETKRLDRIVNQIIDYVRPRTLAPVSFSMEDLIHETIAALKGSFETKHVTVECQFHPNLSRIEADRDQIKQVLLNVLQNAIEVLDEGGSVRIMAFDLPREQGPGMTMQVIDRGRGITPADLPHVFEPFFTSGKRRGTGLGLAISRNIIDAHQGDIVISSNPHEGTVVRIWLPLRQPPRIVVS
jgi:PAS domain S-box-containing protein